MSVRHISRIALLGLIGAALGACGGDSPTSAGTGGNPISNPTGLLNVGDLLNINVNVNDACTNAMYHPSRVVAVGTHSIIFADTLNPKGGFTTSDYQKFAAKFDTLVYPLDVDNFGAPTDIDQNGGRIAIVFTRAVNELTPASSSSYVGGLAYSRDLFPKSGNAGGRASPCAGSNEGEYFYAMTPDPLGTINGNVRRTGFVDSNTTAVLAHEFQHIINSSRRLYVTNAPAFEEKWLDEGLAHIAEELLFYKEAGLTSRLNLDVNALRASSKITTAFNLEQSGNSTRYRLYLQATQSSSPYAANDSLTTRGSAWDFIRYSVDRVNATDNFLPGSGQVVTGSGDIGVSAGSTAAEFTAIVVNTTLQTSGNLNYALKTSSSSGDLISEAAVPAYLKAPIADEGNQPVRDEAFESRIRTRERVELTPRMAGARAWYASRVASSPELAPSFSLSSSSMADADGTLFYKLVNSQLSGIANFQQIVGGDMAGFIRDWAVAQVADDLVAPGTQYQQRSWNYRSVFPAISQNSAYPLTVAPLSINGVANINLVSGGAAYFRLAVPVNGTATLSLSPASGTPNPSLQLIVIRTK